MKRKRKPFIPTKGVRRGMYSSEETVDSIEKLREDMRRQFTEITEKIDNVDERIKEAEGEGIGGVSRPEPWFYFKKVLPGIPPDYTPDEDEAGMGKYGSPWYLMRRTTRLIRGGVPTSGMRAFRRILYTMPGAGLALAGVFAFIEATVNIVVEWHMANERARAERRRDTERIAERKKIVDEVRRQLERERRTGLRSVIPA